MLQYTYLKRIVCEIFWPISCSEENISSDKTHVFNVEVGTHLGKIRMRERKVGLKTCLITHGLITHAYRLDFTLSDAGSDRVGLDTAAPSVLTPLFKK